MDFFQVMNASMTSFASGPGAKLGVSGWWWGDDAWAGPGV